ncbi:PA2778 family cysteine peptidase [Pandoraea terrae]|uniref:PA2778 family cysteine peptidase n=1 Tax=Pandoraea terrae TaxID=1537710 RepID=UPI001CD2F8D9|nr:PA2778 family cysteine peptidase [Pandoraea terrae]
MELAAVPFFPQDDYQCGPAALATVLTSAGVALTPETLVDQVYLPARKGSLQVEMLATTRRNGLLPYVLAPQLIDVLREVASGTPVLVLQNMLVSWYPLWHYAVVIGYDLDKSRLILRSGKNPRQVLPFWYFEHTWAFSDHWAMLAIRADHVPETASEHGYASAVAALEASGKAAAATTAYTSLLARWPSSLAGEIGLGNALYARGQLREAEAAYRRATKDHPDSAPAFNNLAQTLADQGRLPEALQAAQHAVGLGGPFLPASQATLRSILDKETAPASAR